MREIAREVCSLNVLLRAEGKDPYDALILIGRQCNFLQKKGEVDESRAAMKIIDDWQKGALINGSP